MPVDWDWDGDGGNGGGGQVRRLTYWGDQLLAVRGWVSDSEVLVLSGTG